MTCIVGLVKGGTVWLGGDRAATDGHLRRTIIKHPKVFEKASVGFGICGLPKVADAVEHGIELPIQASGDDKAFLVNELVPALREGMKKLDCAAEEPGWGVCFMGAMLIAYNGRLYQLEGNFQLVESDIGFAAVGSGGEPALGSLRATVKWRNPRKRCLEALKVSAENNAGVAPPFDVIAIKKR